MTEQIQKIVTELPDLADVKGVRAVADDRFARGDAAFVADLAIALAKAYDEQMWQYRSVSDYLLRLLATTAGQQNITQALRLVASMPAGGKNLAPYTASLLAASHPPDDLAVAFTGEPAEELRACLVQELVLRGSAVTETRIAEWATSPHRQEHALGWLPLALSDVEERPSLPSYSTRGGSHSIPHGPVGTGDMATVDGAAGGLSSQETTTDATASAMAEAVANWAEESNGRIEARVFDLAEPLDADSVPNALLTLGLACLDGVGETAVLSASACGPTRVWRLLYAAASTGGAYNSGAYGAYGRLAAWRSLAGLTSASKGATFREVEARVGKCAWHVFNADTRWFERVAWDIGVACLAPDRRRLAVLAATDTD